MMSKAVNLTESVPVTGPRRSRANSAVSTAVTPISEMSVEEMDRELAILDRMLGGVIGDDVKERWKVIRAAQKTAETCGGCGGGIGVEDTVYLYEVSTGGRGFCAPQAPICEACAPRFMKREDRWCLEWPCATCQRPIVFRESGRDFWRDRVFCSDRCRWTFYNRQRDERNAQAREKVCESCGEPFTATRADAKTCSAACKQKAYRRRRKGVAA